MSSYQSNLEANMSIIITPENFKKYAKRQQKTINEYIDTHGKPPSLNDSQEILAKTLGFSNYHEFITKINEPKISDSQSFLNDLNSLVNNKKSTIQKCFVANHKINEFKNTIELQISVDGDDYFILQIPNKNINNKEFLEKDLRRANIEEDDIKEILNILHKNFNNAKHEGLFFAVEFIEEFLKEKRNIALKNNPCNINNEFLLNGDIFVRQFSCINFPWQITNDSEKHKTTGMVKVPYSNMSGNKKRTNYSDSDIDRILEGTNNIFVESYVVEDYDFKENVENEIGHTRLIKSIWIHEQGKLVKINGWDILEHFKIQ